MAIRTTYLLLACCAGGLAAFGGWWFGDQLFFQSASASLTKDETEVVAQYPLSNRDIKNDRAIVAAPVDPGPASQILATANAYLAAPPPRVATPPKPEKPSRLLLSDMQVAGIKQRLKLSAAQEKYWPPMETALREVMAQIYDYQKRGKKSDETFDTESASITRLKETARALFAQLRTEQKNEIMMLARVAGVSSVVAEMTGGKAVAKNDE